MGLYKKLSVGIAFVLFAVLALAIVSIDLAAAARASGYRQSNLVSDLRHIAPRRDVNLVNPWGIAFSPTGLLWVNDNGSGISEVFKPNGQRFGLVVVIPPPVGSIAPATPTGIVLNTTDDFVVSNGLDFGPCRFIFATEDGTISGWNPDVDLTEAILAVDNSASGAVYKGVTIGTNSSGNFIFATNFHAGTIDVFDKDFAPAVLSGTFTDPNVPAGFAPFGIRNIDDIIVVTYAKQLAPDNHDDEAGPGNGLVNLFDTDGNLIARFATGGTLNSPWGLAWAPDDFGLFAGALLVGNFGDGRINAFDSSTGEYLGQVANRRGVPLVNDGLWGLTFFSRSTRRGETAPPNALFFSAGLNQEADGLLGIIRPVPSRTRTRR